MTDRHTAIDYAHVLKDSADVHFPHKTAIVLFQDNLNIHSKASLYEAFPPAEARRLLKARILLKADVSEGGPGWSDSKIIAALDSSLSMLYRVRKQLVEEGFEAVLSRKQRATPAVAPIFDGEKEAKLIALACSKPPKGRARWTLRLLENKVVELGIVDRASDSTIHRTLKKTVSNRIAGSAG